MRGFFMSCLMACAGFASAQADVPPAKGAPVPPKSVLCFDGAKGKGAEFSLVRRPDGRYTAALRTFGLKGRELSVPDAEEGGLGCNFDGDARVFSCGGGSKFAPRYARAQQVTTKSIALGGSASTASVYEVSLHKSSGPNKPGWGLDFSFQPDDCRVEP